MPDAARVLRMLHRRFDTLWPMELRTKRIHAAPSVSDGTRILVDRLWPRGVPKEDARVDHWAKSIAPSSELRRWYDHDPAKWDEFRQRYFAELDANDEGVDALLAAFGKKRTTFLFASREEKLNNAAALRIYLEERGKV